MLLPYGVVSSSLEKLNDYDTRSCFPSRHVNFRIIRGRDGEKHENYGASKRNLVNILFFMMSQDLTQSNSSIEKSNQSYLAMHEMLLIIYLT